MSKTLHVVFGAGQVGSRLAQVLLDHGHAVRVAKRSPGGIPAGAEAALGDAAHSAFCATAARGATAVYHCMNPTYSTRAWSEAVPRNMANLIEAAARVGARLVVLDNVYMLGRPNRKPLGDETPMNPCSRKGEIRACAARMLFGGAGRSRPRRRRHRGVGARALRRGRKVTGGRRGPTGDSSTGNQPRG